MRFNSRFVRMALTAVALATMGVAGSARAQSDAAAPPPPGGPGPGAKHMGPGGPGDEIRFIGFEMGLEGKTVAGAPFSATFSTQTTQTLSDGNQIQRSTTGTVARDSQGRTRREMTLPAIGPWATSGKTPPRVAFVNDPVAGTRYVLDENDKVAHQTRPATAASKATPMAAMTAPE